MSQRTYVRGERICCAECSADLARFVITSGSVATEPIALINIGHGWILEGHTWKATRHAKERLRQGKQAAFRRWYESAAPDRTRYIMNWDEGTQIQCWSCGLVQMLEKPSVR